MWKFAAWFGWARVAGVIMTSTALSAAGQPPLPVGGEFQVNTYTTGFALFPSVAVDSDGDFVVVWDSYGSPGNDTSGNSIQAQRYTSGGSAVGDQFQVNTYTTSSTSVPSVAADSDGDFVVVWESYGSPGDDASHRSIQGRRYASDGSARGAQFQVNTYTTERQGSASVAARANGDFVVVWSSDGSSGTDTSLRSVLGQRYASDGAALGSEFQVNTYTTGSQVTPAVSTDSDGDFVVVWQRSVDSYPFPTSIQGQRYTSDGSAVGAAFQVNTDAPVIQSLPAVAVDSDGDFVVVWQGYGVQGRRYASDGSAAGDQFQVNTYTTDAQYYPAVAVDSDGDFVVVWNSYGSPGDDASNLSVQGRRYASDGSARGDQFQVNTYTTSYQLVPAVAVDPDGDFIVAWLSAGSSGNDPVASIQGQRFAAEPANQPPSAQCTDVTVAADAGRCSASASIDDGSSDPESATLSLEQDPAGPYSVGTTSVTLTVTDPEGASASCRGEVTVSDEEPPAIACNAPAELAACRAPVSYTATASDNCEESSVVVTDFDCSAFTRKGKRVERACKVSSRGAKLKISHGGGVGNHVQWTVEATDSSGNEQSATCELEIVRGASRMRKDCRDTARSCGRHRDRKHAEEAHEAFAEEFHAKYPKAVECLREDED